MARNEINVRAEARNRKGRRRDEESKRRGKMGEADTEFAQRYKRRCCGCEREDVRDTQNWKVRLERNANTKTV